MRSSRRGRPTPAAGRAAPPAPCPSRPEASRSRSPPDPDRSGSAGAIVVRGAPTRGGDGSVPERRARRPPGPAVRPRARVTPRARSDSRPWSLLDGSWPFSLPWLQPSVSGASPYPLRSGTRPASSRELPAAGPTPGSGTGRGSNVPARRHLRHCIPFHDICLPTHNHRFRGDLSRTDTGKIPGMRAARSPGALSSPNSPTWRAGTPGKKSRRLPTPAPGAIFGAP